MLRQSCNMEVFSLYCLIFLALLAQSRSEPHFTSQPGKEITAFYGEKVNFTWKYSDQSLLRIAFGLYNSEYGALETHLLSIDWLSNGTLNVVPYTDSKEAEKYDGRLEWIGDFDNKTVSFELSQIKYSDKKFYGVELEFNDTDATMIESYTKLIVKTPSTFASSPGTLFLLRGQDAIFTWKYKLNEEDQKTLTTVLFGVYRQNRFEELCKMEVKTGNAGCNGKRKVLIVSLKAKEKVVFQLTKINLDDEATYSIRLLGTQRPMENQSELVVQDPPAFTKHPVKSLTVNETGTFKLSCAASGRPTPKITWYKDNHVIQDNSTGKYFVNDARKEDAGKYYCVAVNEVGNATSTPSVVYVQYSPIINTKRKIKLVHAPIGKKVKFTCPTRAIPPPKIQWYSPYSVDSNSNGPVLEVSVRNEMDYGNYTCRASNILGEDKVLFTLEKVGPPSAPVVDCEKQGHGSQSRSVIFRWRFPDDDGGAEVTQFTVKRRELEEQRHTKWINKNVSKTTTWFKYKQDWQTTHEFAVTAWNIYGESKFDPEHTCIYTTTSDPGPETTTATSITKSTVAAALRDGAKDKENIMVYVGICIALLALIAVVVMLIVYRVKKNRSKKESWNNHQNLSYDRVLSVGSTGSWEGASAGDKLLGSIPRSRAQTMVGSPSYQLDPEWNVPREKICIMKVIGNGAFGLVYKGRVHGVGANAVGWNIVAIKSPYADATDAEVRDLMKEFELLKSLKPHPHVIKLLGCGEDEGRPLVIIEYVPFGDLLGYLRKSRGEEDDYYSDPEIKPTTNLSSQQLIRFAWHVTDGMTYLASEKIIHRDLAARNVLVGEGMSCKITDFGMARDVSNDDIYLRTTEGRLPVKWTAIEALTGSGEYTTKSDVWSFGVVLYEICTIGADPYPGINGKEIPERLDSGYRMPRPGHVDSELYDIMMSCWRTDPEERPTFPELKEKLVQLEEVQSRDYINLSECLYQNVSVRSGSVKEPKRRSLLGLSKSSKKEPAKGNDYQEGPPGLHGHAVTAV